jgi:predicted secreted protein
VLKNIKKNRQPLFYLILGLLLFTFEITKQGAIAMKAIKYFSFILLFGFSSQIYTQIPDTVWTKTFGGPLADVGNSVKQTNDGGYIIAGTTSSFGAGGQDIWLIKTDENGDTLWTKTFGGIGNDRAANVVQTNDNGLAVFGTTNSFGNGGDDFLFWKIDSLGNTEWFKTYGESTNEICSEGKQTIDGGFIITGYFYSQIYKSLVIKLDELGSVVWDKILIRSNSDLWARSIEQTINNWYIIGCTWGHYYLGGYAYEWYVYGLAENGDSLFSTELWNVGYDFFKSVRNTKENGYILGGSTAGEFIWLKKMGPNGWNRIISVPQTYVYLSSLEATADSGFIITATVSDNTSSRDIILLKINKGGNVQWGKRIIGNGIEDAYSVYPTSDDGYIVTGQTNSVGAGGYDIWLLKFRSDSTLNFQIDFFPTVDTAWVFSNSIGPDIITHNFVSTPFRDSITIEPGPNSAFFYYDSSGNLIPVDKYYFIVISQSNQKEYELWLHPKSRPPFVPMLIPFDSVFQFRENKFEIQLVVKQNGYTIDSLTQIFKTDWGLNVKENEELPYTYNLHQNFPNPFNPKTKIGYEISESNFVTINVYDILGNEITTLVSEEKQPGTYEVEFDGKQLPSGIYFYQLKAGNYIETKKMVLIK